MSVPADYVRRGGYAFDPYLLKALAKAAMQIQQTTNGAETKREEAKHD